MPSIRHFGIYSLQTMLGGGVGGGGWGGGGGGGGDYERVALIGGQWLLMKS